MPKSYTNLLYHIVFSTKDRQPIITADYQSRLYDYIGRIIRGLENLNCILTPRSRTGLYALAVFDG